MNNKPKQPTIYIDLSHDQEADVWYVQRSNIPGLCVEGGTLHMLLSEIGLVADDLIKANGVIDDE